MCAPPPRCPRRSRAPGRPRVRQSRWRRAEPLARPAAAALAAVGASLVAALPLAPGTLPRSRTPHGRRCAAQGRLGGRPGRVGNVVGHRLFEPRKRAHATGAKMGPPRSVFSRGEPAWWARNRGQKIGGRTQRGDGFLAMGQPLARPLPSRPPRSPLEHGRVELALSPGASGRVAGAAANHVRRGIAGAGANRAIGSATRGHVVFGRHRRRGRHPGAPAPGRHHERPHAHSTRLRSLAVRLRRHACSALEKEIRMGQLGRGRRVGEGLELGSGRGEARSLGNPDDGRLSHALDGACRSRRCRAGCADALRSRSDDARTSALGYACVRQLEGRRARSIGAREAQEHRRFHHQR